MHLLLILRLTLFLKIILLYDLLDNILRFLFMLRLILISLLSMMGDLLIILLN